MSLVHVAASLVPHVRFNSKSMDYFRFNVHAMLPHTHSTKFSTGDTVVVAQWPEYVLGTLLLTIEIVEMFNVPANMYVACELRHTSLPPIPLSAKRNTLKSIGAQIHNLKMAHSNKQTAETIHEAFRAI